MRVPTFLGILLALVVVVTVAYLTQQNIELLQQPLELTETVSVPLYAALLAVFLLGFLPVVSILLVKTLQQDLARRRQRRFDRQAKSLRGSYRRAVDFQEDGQLSRAASEFEAVLADQPEDFGTLLRYGEVLRRQGKVEEAVDVHRRASVLYPQSAAVLYELAEDYAAQGSPDVADQIRDRILRDFSGLGLRVLQHRRQVALLDHDWERANLHQEKIEALEVEGDEGPFEAEERSLRRGLTYEKGVALLESEHLEEAREAFQGILADDPQFVAARIMLGEVALLTDSPSAAVEEWQQGWRATGSPTFLQRIEDHFIEREEPLAAIETLRRIIAEAENDLLPRFFLGKLYARLEMHDEALKVLASIRDRVQDSPSLLYLMGRLHERRGEPGQASRAFRDSLALARLATNEYLCRICGAHYTNWQARCEKCDSWSGLELHFDLEPISGDELALRERPIWPVNDEE